MSAPKYKKDWSTVHFFLSSGQCITIQAKDWTVRHQNSKPTSFTAGEVDRRIFIDMDSVVAIVVDPAKTS